MDDGLITQSEAAQLLNVSRQRVEQMIRAGALTAHSRPVPTRVVSRADVERLAATPRKRGRPRTHVLSAPVDCDTP